MCLLLTLSIQGRWDEPYISTYHLVTALIVDGEVVDHLEVKCCHGNLWGLVVGKISHWSLQSYNGAVVLNFHREERRSKTGYRNRQNCLFPFG